MHRDPFRRHLEAAPVDDEPVTVEEEAAIAEVDADRAAGVTTLQFNDVKRRYAYAGLFAEWQCTDVVCTMRAWQE